MLLAELICSDDDCDFTIEVIGDDADLGVLVCDGCGCCLQVVSVSEVELVGPMASPTPLRAPRRDHLRHAA